ncbi:MAG TPA: aminopeptidase N, partial [Microbacterium sp.]|nr:aminopeptidase N [Microbacterium sp.]
YAVTQMEPTDARRAFPCWDEPALKAVYQVTLVVDDKLTAISNARAVRETVLPGTGKKAVVFADTIKMSTYLVAFIVGEFEATDPVPAGGALLRVCAVPGKKRLADFALEIGKASLEHFASYYGIPYPADKLDLIAIPDFASGAMENLGAITFRETALLVDTESATRTELERVADVVSHENAHMWFGDLVTMKWWNGLWLNESFAEWASTIATAEATEWTEAWTTFNAMEKTWAYRQDQLPSTHPVVAEINDLEDVQVNFDGITYAKGGSVLKQLAAWVGIEAFFAGVAEYFKKNEWGNTELSDLLSELEKTSGRELATWSKKWLETAGVNTLSPVISEDGTGTITRFAITQTAPADYPTIRPHRLGVGFYNVVDGGLERVHHVELDVDGDLTEVPELKGQARPDLVLLNDEDLAYAKIRLDDRSLSTAMEHLGGIADPLARSLVWGAAWDQTRDAESSPSDYVDLVLRNIGSETESTTVRTTLAQLQLAANSYVAPDKRDAARVKVADGLWALAEAADAGSDSQLQFVTAFATAASTPAHWERVKSLRDGDTTLEGLEVDTDLSWQLLVSLAAGGVADTQAIDDALAADNTAKGGEFAAQAKASIPDAAAKRAAWDSLIENDDLPNTIVRSTALGFQHPATIAQLGDFVGPYFDMLLPIWESRSYQIAQYIIVGLYPAPLANVALRDATRAWLAENRDAAPALRRLVDENLAGVERAILVQERDAE